jgi:hypothetical protein
LILNDLQESYGAQISSHSFEFGNLGTSNSMAASVKGLTVTFDRVFLNQRIFYLKPLYISVPKIVEWQGRKISAGYAAEVVAGALNETVMLLSYKYGEPFVDPLYMLPGSKTLYEIDLLEYMNIRVGAVIPGARVRFIQPGDIIKPKQAIFVRP